MKDIDVKTCIHLSLLSRLRNHEVSPPIPYTILQRVARHGNNFNFEIRVPEGGEN
jgi:hypothetical protein